MALAARGSAHFRFGDFEVDFRAGELRRGDSRIKLGERPFHILAALLEHPGEVVTREELRQRLWPPDVFVDFEHSINTAVQRLRDALGDDAEKPLYIETLPRHGYRLIATVHTGTVREPPLKIRSVAVLPLENLSNDPAQEFFADAMTEELITNLGRSGSLRIISRTSVMQYKRTLKPLPEIAKELNVDAVVEGTVLRYGDRVRITANLLHAPTDRHLWAESYGYELKDTLAVQIDVTSAIAYAIRTILEPAEQLRPALPDPHPVHPEAYNAYLKGRYYSRRLATEEYKRASEYFAKAIEIDPNYAPAYAAIADNYMWASYGLGLSRNEYAVKGHEAARRAVELDPTLAEAHVALAGQAFFFDWDWATAEKEYRRAMQLNPNLVAAREGYAEFLMRMGRFEDSIRERKRAQELDPLSPAVNTQLAWSYGAAHRFDECMTQLRDVLELDPNFAMAHFNLGQVYELMGKHEDAIKEIRAALAARYEFPFLAYLGFIYGRVNQPDKALEVLAEMQTRARNENVSLLWFGMVYLGLGQTDKALSCCEEAYEQRDVWVLTLKASPEFDPLRSNPRFQALVRRMNFPP